MRAEHLEVLVEEPSMEAFLLQLLPRMIGESATFTVHAHQGKMDFLSKLDGRLRGYAKWLTETTRILIVVDRDNDDCHLLKRRLEGMASSAGLVTRTITGTHTWQVVNRIAVEELEAWFFGEWAGLRKAYPKVPASVTSRAPFRAPDAILGGTWEALERILVRAGYFRTGLRKLEIARSLGVTTDPRINASPSFVVFRDAVLEAINA